MKIFKDLAWFFKLEKKAYISGVALLVFVAFLELIPPKMIGFIVDQIHRRTLTKETLIGWMSLLGLVAILLYTCRFIWRYQIYGASLRLARRFRNDLYSHYTKMSPSFYQKYRTGDLMAHATNDIQAVQQTVGNGILSLVDSFTLGTFVLITMAFTINWKLTIISILPMPFMAFSQKRYGQLIYSRFDKAQASFSKLNDQVVESINGISVIKSLGQEEEDIQSFEKQSEDVVEKNLAVAKVDALFDPTISLVVGFSLLLSIVFGARFVLENEMTLGQFMSFQVYLGYLVWPMLAFGWLFNIVERGRASYDRISKLLAIKEDIQTGDDAIREVNIGDLKIDIDKFNFPSSIEPSLHNIHLTVKTGETLGIVGKTGSGKTAIVKLLLRQFDLTEGAIYYGSEDYSNYDINALRKCMSYVPQEQFLFSATIYENIAFAKPDATKSDIEKVAKIACIHDDIVGFPEGYQTVVGERGVSLSGGQKQRISIARALLLNSDLLLLDDCLSAVDARTEAQIINALKEERTNQTTIIISHRMSAVKHANQILVLDSGTSEHIGTHEELMGQDTWYKRMVEKQRLEEMVDKEDANE